MQKTKSGFTIVELLIVIVIVAILAAISIAAYNGIQTRAIESTVKSDLAAIKKKIELARATSNELYPEGGGASTLEPLGIKITKSAYATTPQTSNNLWYCRNSTQNMFTFIALAKTGKVFYISESVGPTQYTGAQAWSSTNWNCDTMVNSNQGWQYQGYASDGTDNGPWRPWIGGN